MRRLIATKAANIFAPMLYLAIARSNTVNPVLSIGRHGLWPLKKGQKTRYMPLFDMHHQPHLGVDVAADLEGSRRCKGFGNILARITLIAVEGKAGRLDIDLMDEIVIVGEGQALAAIDIDLARVKGPALLDDGMRFVCGEGCSGKKHEKQEQFFHCVTT